MKNQQGAPEALRLAAEVLDWMPTSDTQRALWDRHQKALVVVKAALVEAQQPATHVQNPAEIEHVTGDVSKNGAEVNMSTQQPAPAGATQDDGIAARRAKYLRNDTDAGRAYVAQYLRSMGQHYFDDYIQTDLAGDFACALAASLSLSTPQPAPATQQAGATKEHLRIVRVIADKIEDGTLFQSGIYSNKDLARFVRNVADAAAPQFPTAQPAPATQQPCPTCAALARTVMLDQVSFDRKPDCYGIRQITDDEGVEEWEDIRTSPDVAREEANDMMATGRGEIYEVVPLWTTPQPSPTPQADSQPAPIDMVLHCPKCGLQHIDAPEKNDRRLAAIDPPAAWAMDPWTNEPHRSHLCHGCGHIWRPADVPTNGVAAVKTTGKADSPIAASATSDSVTAPAGGATYHLGACIVDGVLSATVMRKEPGRAGAVTVLLSEQIPVEHLQDRDVIVDATPPARAADSVLEDADPIRALIAQHAAILAQNESAYFELCYHRATGWMAWITDKPLCMPPVVNPDRKVLAQGQGDTADEACRDAARKQGGA